MKTQPRRPDSPPHELLYQIHSQQDRQVEDFNRNLEKAKRHAVEPMLRYLLNLPIAFLFFSSCLFPPILSGSSQF
jgi:hypothetical protein